MQRIDQAGGGNDRGSMLIVMENRNIHQLAQLLFNDETVRGLDILEIDSAESGPKITHGTDEFIDVLGVDFKVNGIDVGKAFEQNGLAFHYRLRSQGAQIAQTKNCGAI